MLHKLLSNVAHTYHEGIRSAMRNIQDAALEDQARSKASAKAQASIDYQIQQIAKRKLWTMASAA